MFAGLIHTRKFMYISGSQIRSTLKCNLNISIWQYNFNSQIMNYSQFPIRKWQKKDFAPIIDLIKQEPWNISVNELQLAYEIDPEGGFVATNENGQIIAAAVACNIDDELSSGLVYIVHASYRSKGIGPPLMDSIQCHVANRNTLGTAAPHMAHKYAASGGANLGETILRFAGKVTTPFSSENGSFEVVKFSDSLFDKLLQYEAKICKPIKPNLLNKWLNQSSSLALVALANDTIYGYGVICEATNSTRVAPLFADNEIIAKNLLHKLGFEFNLAQKKGFTIDLSKENQLGIQLVQDMNCENVRTFFYTYKLINKLTHYHKIYSRLNWQTSS